MENQSDDALLLIASKLLCIPGVGPYAVPRLSMCCNTYYSLLNSNGFLSKAKEAAPLTWIASHTWHIHQFTTNRSHQLFSEYLSDDQGNCWRLLLFPFGNNNNNKYLSLYVQPFNNRDCDINIKFTLHNKCPSKTITRKTSIALTEHISDWGFKELMDNESPNLSDIFRLSRGWLIDDVLTISVEVTTLQKQNRRINESDMPLRPREHLPLPSAGHRPPSDRGAPRNSI